MPQYVEVPELGGLLEFPDNLSFEEIKTIVERDAPRLTKRAGLVAERAKLEAGNQTPTLLERLQKLGLGTGPQAVGEFKRQTGKWGELAAKEMEATPQRDILQGDPRTEALMITPSGFVKPIMAGIRWLSEKVAPIGTGGTPEPIKSLAEAPAMLAERGKKEVEEIREIGKAVANDPLSNLLQDFGATATTSAAMLPFIAGGGAVAGTRGAIAVGSALSGLQSAGASYGDFKDKLIKQGMSEEEADRRARGTAILSGLITAGVTRAFGATGLEALGRGITRGGVQSLAKQLAVDIGSEGAEEAIDQGLQGVLEKMAINPEKPVSEIVNEMAIAGVFGGALGGLTGGAREGIGRAAEAIARPLDTRLQGLFEDRRFQRASETAADLQARMLMRPDVPREGNQPLSPPIRFLPPIPPAVKDSLTVQPTLPEATGETQLATALAEPLTAAQVDEQLRQQQTKPETLPAPPVRTFEERFPVGSTVDYTAPGSISTKESGRIVGYRRDPTTGDTFAEIELTSGRREFAGDINDIRLIQPTPAPANRPTRRQPKPRRPGGTDVTQSETRLPSSQPQETTPQPRDVPEQAISTAEIAAGADVQTPAVEKPPEQKTKRTVTSTDLPDAQNANETTWYHGSRTTIAEPSSSFTRIENLLGTGFYTTDDPEVANTYKRGPAGQLHEVKVNVSRVVNFEKPLTDDVAKVFMDSVYPQFRPAIEQGIKDGKTGMELWKILTNAVAEESQGEMIPVSEYVEMFQTIESSLREAGVDAITHIGGLRAGKGKQLHRVLILLDPAAELGSKPVAKTVRGISVAIEGDRYVFKQPAPQPERQVTETRLPSAETPAGATGVPAGEALTAEGLAQKISRLYAGIGKNLNDYLRTAPREEVLAKYRLASEVFRDIDTEMAERKKLKENFRELYPLRYDVDGLTASLEAHLMANPQPSVTPAGEASSKQPWEMTREEWMRGREDILNQIDQWETGAKASPGQPKTGQNYQLVMRTERARLEKELKDMGGFGSQNNHASLVARAVQEGKPVPAEVLADYPDLRPSLTPAEQTQARSDLATELGEEMTGTAKPKALREGKERLQQAIQDLQASNTPAIWIDEEVITPNGKYGVQSNGTLKRKQDLSVRGFERNLDYVIDSMANNPQNEGQWWGANQAAKERIQKILAEREIKAQAEATKRAQAEAEALRKQELRREYDTEWQGVDIGKGKKQSVTVPTEDSVTGKKGATEISMTVHGTLGIRKNEARNTPYKYFVTHVPTGLSLGNDLKIETLAQAKDFIKALFHTGVDLSKTEFTNDELSRLAAAKDAMWREPYDVPAWWLTERSARQPKPDTRESLPAGRPSGLPTDLAQSTLQRWQAAHPNALPVEIVNEPGAAWRGFYQGERITVNLAQIGTQAELNETLNEEYAHSLIASPAGQQMLDSVVASMLGESEMATLRERYQPRLGESAEAYNRRLRDEFIAQAFAENRTVWQRIVEAVRRFLARFGLTELTDREIARGLLKSLQSENPAVTGELRESYPAFISRAEKEAFKAQPGFTAEVQSQIELAAQAQAQLVPDSMAETIRGFGQAPVEQRLRSLLGFLLELRDLAIPQALSRILGGNNPESVKDLATSAVLLQVANVRNKVIEFNEARENAMEKMERHIDSIKDANEQRLTEQQAGQTVKYLLDGYRDYLKAKAATLPAKSNVQSEFNQVIQRMEERLGEWEVGPGGLVKALRAIANNLVSLPIDQGPTAVASYIRSSGMLNGVASQDVIDFLTLPKQGGLPSAIEATPRLIQDLRDLQEVQSQSAAYAQQMREFEQVFARMKDESGKVPKDPTRVELRKWASEYYKWRTRREKARKLAGQLEKQIQQADEDFEVYTRASDFLTTLQQHPQFLENYETALRAADVMVRDIQSADPQTGATIYKGPLTGREYRIDLRPDREADEAALEQMRALLEEVDTFLDPTEMPNADPALTRTWQRRQEYIRRFLYYPQFGDKIRPMLNPFEVWRNFIPLAKSRMRSARAELSWMDYRGALQALREFQLGDYVNRQFQQLRNDKEIGYSAINNAVLAAVKSHGREADWAQQWESRIAEPIIASQQTIGQIALTPGKWVYGEQITREDLHAISLMKRFSNRALLITQKAGHGTPYKFYNPLQVDDKHADLSITRNALGPGVLTMARIASRWGEGFVAEWSRSGDLQAALKSGDEDQITTVIEQKLQLLQDGPHFRYAVLGRVLETNPEFDRQSPYNRLYRKLAAAASEDPALNFTSLNQLVDWLAPETVAAGIHKNETEARKEIVAQIVKEVDRDTWDFSRKYLDEKVTPKPDEPESMVRVTSGKSSFTEPRKLLFAPSTYYSYSLAQDTRRSFYTASAYTAFQLRQWKALLNLIKGLEDKALEYESAVEAMDYASPAKARKAVQKASKAAAEAGQTRYDYKQLTEYVRRLKRIQADLEELASDQPAAFDSAGLYAMQQGLRTLSAGVLATGQSITNNTTGGIFTVPFLIDMKLGRASYVAMPMRVTKEAVTHLLRSTLKAVAGNKAMTRVLQSNLVGWRNIAALIQQQILTQQELYRSAYDKGLVNPGDVSGRLKAIRQVPGQGGRIEFGEVPTVAKAFNLFEAIPGLRWALEQLKDKSPRIADDLINLTNMTVTQKRLWLHLQNEAIAAFEAREKLAAGGTVNPNDFTKPENLLKPQEIGLKWKRHLDFHRELFSPAGLFDEILLNYYQRWKVATDKTSVPLFEKPEDEAAVIYEAGAKGNITTPSNLPFIFQGVGYKGQIKGAAFMFWGWPTRIIEQLSQLMARNRSDPKWRSIASNYYAVFGVMVMMAMVGVAAREFGQFLVRIWTGRSSSQIKLANVLNDPSAESAMRYTALALAANLPYYGDKISWLAGNPAYKASWMDLSEIIPAAGFARDLGNAVKKITDTGDIRYAGADLLNRWMPPVSPIIRLLPSMSGDVTARNASRALRAAAPKDMELLMQRTMSSGGGQYRSTPSTIAIRDLLSAAYRGDSAGVATAYQRAVEEKRQAGAADPEGAVLASIQGKVPARAVFGRSITPDEESRILGRMSGGQRADYLASKRAFELIGGVLGRQINTVKQPQAIRSLMPTTSRPRFRTSRFGRRGRYRSTMRLPRLRRLGSRRSRRRLTVA